MMRWAVLLRPRQWRRSRVLHGNDVGCPEAQALRLSHRRLVARAVQELQQPPAPPTPCVRPAPCTVAVTAGNNIAKPSKSHIAMTCVCPLLVIIARGKDCEWAQNPLVRAQQQARPSGFYL